MYIFKFSRELLKFRNYNILSFCNIVRGVFKTRLNILDGVFYWNLLTVFVKRFIVDVWLVSGNASDCYRSMLEYVPLLKSYFNGLLVAEYLIYCRGSSIFPIS